MNIKDEIIQIVKEHGPLYIQDIYKYLPKDWYKIYNQQMIRNYVNYYTNKGVLKKIKISNVNWSCKKRVQVYYNETLQVDSE